MEKSDILTVPSDAEIETGLSQAFLVLEDRDQGRYRRILEYVLQVRDRTREATLLEAANGLNKEKLGPFFIQDCAVRWLRHAAEESHAKRP